MSRIINFENAGKTRTHLLKELISACREIRTCLDFNDDAKDLAAFIFYTLEAIDQTINMTVSAWEKRNYWVKADKFQVEWSWVKNSLKELDDALANKELNRILVVSDTLITVIPNNSAIRNIQDSKPWIGTWQKYIEKNNSRD